MCMPRAYKWIALSNTTLGVLMAALNGNIILISLPAVFRGIGIDPLAPGEIGYLLWILLGYMVVTAVFLVTFGRISDMFGRVRLYNAGFAVFTLGSVLLFVTPGHGNAAALWIILMRLVQGVGGAFLFANSAAILTDAFPSHERGLAMGINQIAAVAGSLAGLIIGGLMATVWWRGIFLVSVPFGLLGTVWAYLMLRETARPRRGQRIDWWGNLTFAVGLTALLVGVTYGIQPYGHSNMGWGSPMVVGSLAAGVVLLAVFAWIEARVADPMFRLSLFGIRMFTAGNVSGFAGSLARGGLQFMLIIWLQGIWLPLHGVSFDQTPLQAGIDMIPMMAGFLLMGPLSGRLSDRYGSRGFATGGMVLTAAGFFALTRLPATFEYWTFAAILLLMGIGMGMFSAPNTTAIMNALPPEHRGVGSGMRATFQNAASMLSMGVFFTIVIVGLSRELPGTLYAGLTAAGLPAQVAAGISHLPPTAALFAAFLGYNPMGTLLSGPVLSALPAAARANLLSLSYFPHLIAPAFMVGLRDAFYISIALSLIAAGASLLRGQRYIHGAGGAVDPGPGAPDGSQDGAAEAAATAMAVPEGLDAGSRSRDEITGERRPGGRGAGMEQAEAAACPAAPLEGRSQTESADERVPVGGQRQ
jgi:MFS family permease